MRKIISSKSALAICIASSVLFFAMSMFGLWIGVCGAGADKAIGLLLFGVCLFLSGFLLWYLNRAACIVWVEDGTVKRKGLVGGFYKECPVRSIQRVKIKHSQHEVGLGDFIYLADDRTQEFKKFLRLRKDSYICFRKTKKNLEFLRTFWSGEIER